MQPKVTVVAAGLQEIVKQDYPIEIKQSKVSNAADYFNEILDTVDSDVYCFLSHRDNFTSPRSVSKVIERMSLHPSIGTAYADCLLNNGAYLSPLYFPAFHPNLLGSDIIINSPLFIKKPPTDVRFNTALNLLYFYEYLNRVGRKQFPIHVAHPIFTCVEDNSVNVEIELKKLEQCLNQ